MEFEGTVWRVLPLVKGTSARGEWMKQEVVFELPGEFNRKLCVGFWGDKAQEAGTLQPGESVAVSANVESREYNGRWFTEARVENHPQSGPATAAAGSGSRRAAADGRIRFRRTGLDEFVRRSRRPAVLNATRLEQIKSRSPIGERLFAKHATNPEPFSRPAITTAVARIL